MFDLQPSTKIDSNCLHLLSSAYSGASTDTATLRFYKMFEPVIGSCDA